MSGLVLLLDGMLRSADSLINRTSCACAPLGHRRGARRFVKQSYGTELSAIRRLACVHQIRVGEFEEFR